MAVSKQLVADAWNAKQPQPRVLEPEDIYRMNMLESRIYDGLLKFERTFTVASYGGTWLKDWVYSEFIDDFIKRYTDSGWNVKKAEAEWVGWEITFS